jgi:hypothetical protein
VELQRLFSVEESMVARSGTVIIAQTLGVPEHTYWPRSD